MNNNTKTPSAVEELAMAYCEESGVEQSDLADAALKEMREYRELCNKTMCAYCGFIHDDGTDQVAIFQHVMTCEKRPEKKLLEKAFEIEDRLYARIIHLTQYTFSPNDCEMCQQIAESLAIYRPSRIHGCER